MTQQIIDNGQTGLTVRTAINANFTELYASMGGGGGTAWDFNPPSAADFSNAYGDTMPTAANDVDVGMIVTFPNPTHDSASTRVITKTIPDPGADWTVTSKMRITQTACIAGASYTGVGMALYTTSTGALYLLKIDVGGNTSFIAGNTSSISGDIGAHLFVGYELWLKLVYTAGPSSLRAYYSIDGKSWVKVLDEIVNAFDSVGFGVFYNTYADTDQAAKVSVPYWQDSFSE